MLPGSELGAKGLEYRCAVSAATDSEPISHVAALDGLRGLAATVVVLRHTFNAIPMPVPFRRSLLESPLALALNAQGAVQLFFVLSGWVLAASLARRAESAPWIGFYVRRVFRIQLPYASAIALAWIASAAWGIAPDAPVTPWLGRARNVDVSLAEFANALLFPGTAHGLLPVGWTLRLEMIYSFAMPLLVLAARYGRGLVVLLASTLVFATPYVDLWYLVDFAIGAVLFQEQGTVCRVLALLGSRLRALVLLVACGLFAAQVALATDRVVAGTIEAGDAWYFIAATALASGIFVALASSGFLAALARPANRFQGRISYSTYLLHRTVLTLLAPSVLVIEVTATSTGYMRRVTPSSAAALFVIVLGLSILLAIPHYRFVERPSIALGGRVARRLAARRSARS